MAALVHQSGGDTGGSTRTTCLFEHVCVDFGDSYARSFDLEPSCPERSIGTSIQ